MVRRAETTEDEEETDDMEMDEDSQDSVVESIIDIVKRQMRERQTSINYRILHSGRAKAKTI